MSTTSPIARPAPQAKGGNVKPATAIVRRPVPPEIGRRRFLQAVGDHAMLIAMSAMFLLPMVFVFLTAVMTDRQTLTPQI